MEVEFRTAADDYLAFYKYYFFQRKLAVRVIVLGMFCLVIGSTLIQDRSLFSWAYVLAVLGLALPIAVFLFILPYRRAVRRFWGVFKAGISDQPRKLIFTADGFDLQWTGEGMEDKPIDSWRWDRVKAVETNASLVMILPFHGPVTLIPRRDFHSDGEAGNLVGIIGNGILRGRGSRRAAGQGGQTDAEKARKWAYWGLLGIVPFIGGVAGVVLLILGILYKSRKLIIIGAVDVLAGLIYFGIFIGVFFHWVFTNPAITDAQKNFARGELNADFKSIEFYKLQHGHYPDSLQQIEDIKGNVWIIDPITHKDLRSGYFFYQKTGDKYWLFSVGKDGEPFTADDVFPTMDPADSAKFGLRLR